MKGSRPDLPPSCCWPIPVEAPGAGTQHPDAGARDATWSLLSVAWRCDAQSVIFPDSEALNACSRLRGRACGRFRSGVPVSFMAAARASCKHQLRGQASDDPPDRQLTTLGIRPGPGSAPASFNSTQRATTDSLTGCPTAVPPKSGPGTSTARQSVRPGHGGSRSFQAAQ